MGKWVMSAAHAWLGRVILAIPQQIGIDPVRRRWLAGAGTPVDGPQPRDAHQPLHPLPAHAPALPRQPDLHAPRPVAGCIQVLSVSIACSKAKSSPEASLGR